MGYRLFCRSQPRASLAIFGIFKKGTAMERSSQYLNAHSMPTDGWTVCESWDLFTDDQRTAQAVLSEALQYLRADRWSAATPLFKQGAGRPQEILVVTAQDVRHKVHGIMKGMGYSPLSRDPEREYMRLGYKCTNRMVAPAHW